MNTYDRWNGFKDKLVTIEGEVKFSRNNTFHSKEKNEPFRMDPFFNKYLSTCYDLVRLFYYNSTYIDHKIREI